MANFPGSLGYLGNKAVVHQVPGVWVFTSASGLL